MLYVADSTKRGLEWATAASQRVLMQADVPRLETLQACQNLVLYWFSVGQTDRAHIHSRKCHGQTEHISILTNFRHCLQDCSSFELPSPEQRWR
jgi:hypothetical protein